MLTVTLFSRPDCHLCEQAKADLAALQSQVPHQLLEVDIDSDPAIQKKYLLEIPVLEVGPYQLKAPFTRVELLMTLSAARDSQEHISRLAEQAPVPAGMNASDRFSLWVADHWLFAVNLLFVFYLGLPMLAPVLMKVGATVPANVIYTAYSPLCHQLGFRSFFLYGEQTYYPRAAAGIAGVTTFGQATGLSENDLFAARAFKGNEQLGYKMALCERDIAIYGAIILFGLLFGLTGRRIPPLHWALWLIIAIGPIGLDGFSQLFSQIPISAIASILPYRESTPTLRLITGFLFGFGTAWFGLPYVEESMRDTRNILARKFSVLQK
ncbi:MAG: DUF2085 domain-containing protein [Chloroflexi bacterium]|nr:DUF2085 domain-containing protein [Chloroflexota bacterium]